MGDKDKRFSKKLENAGAVLEMIGLLPGGF